MKPVDTQEVRTALTAATPGPWERGFADVYTGPNGDDTLIAGCGLSYHPVADANLIANAPTWLADLCDEVKRLRAVATAARAAAPFVGWESAAATDLKTGLDAALDALDGGGDTDG